jgi:F-type H+-transporting ATPase subunit epsilon
MPKAQSIELVVITPERQVLAEAADEVVIPAHDGELGVLNLRSPLMCELGIGQLRYLRDGQTNRLFIDGGFAQVLENRVTVLTGNALLASAVTADVVASAERAVAQHTGYEPDTCAARARAQQRLSALRRIRANA